MHARWPTLIALSLAAMAVVWTLQQTKPAVERTQPTDMQEKLGQAREVQESADNSPAPASTDAPPNASERANPVDVHERARFNERAQTFFAEAPGLSLEQARQRADELSKELSRIEQAGGLSAGETFLLRAGLIRYTVPDEQQQLTQMRALKERYEAHSRQRTTPAAAQSDPMFELYKVRESQVVAEALSLQTIPNGLSRDEYLRQRLQAERERLLGEAM